MIVGRGRDALFVYGSLLENSLRKKILGRDVECEPARVEGYERRHARYFIIVARPGAVTDGLLLSGLGRADLEALDGYEEVGFLYWRELIEVSRSDGGRVRCWIYLPTLTLMQMT